MNDRRNNGKNQLEHTVHLPGISELVFRVYLLVLTLFPSHFNRPHHEDFHMKPLRKLSQKLIKLPDKEIPLPPVYLPHISLFVISILYF